MLYRPFPILEILMSQKNQGNKQSMKGEARGHGKQAESIKSEEHVGSSNSDGIRFPLHDHPDKSVVRPGGK
jgi:hypothetical protein